MRHYITGRRSTGFALRRNESDIVYISIMPKDPVRIGWHMYVKI